MYQMIKNKLPKAVSIMGHRYEIKYYHNTKAVSLDGKDAIGSIDYFKGEVRIHRGTNDQIWCTIWHEVCHIKLWLLYHGGEEEDFIGEKFCDWDAFCMMTLEFEY